MCSHSNPEIVYGGTKIDQVGFRGGFALEMQWRYMGWRPGNEIWVSKWSHHQCKCIGAIIDDSNGMWGGLQVLIRSTEYSTMNDVFCIQNVQHIEYNIQLIVHHITRGGEEMAL